MLVDEDEVDGLILQQQIERTKSEVEFKVEITKLFENVLLVFIY